MVKLAGKLMLLVNSVDREYQETNKLLKCILEEVKTKETTEGSSKLLEAVTENSKKVAQTSNEVIKSIETSNRLLLSEVKTVKEGMSVLWQNTLNSRKKVLAMLSCTTSIPDI